MEYTMPSRIKVLADRRREFWFKIAVFVLITGVVAVFSGFLHYVAVSLPMPIITFFSGAWVASGFSIALS